MYRKREGKGGGGERGRAGKGGIDSDEATEVNLTVYTGNYHLGNSSGSRH